ncbi:hypothetical protein K4P68_04240 [Staphylococcus epidermidis]|uniref:hypothetical protein n=1 Tax=Staphylococcus epidermidis TaxID=1282 RepID=UPI0011AA96ED|nr:hypothetical protein [Staphylococcus epidermidis]MCG1395184.1 hypothetical protein [Staphylococcus epidermidis]MCG2090978.1 hypothetical protein [Staphylococcus epidermidis]
MSQNSEELLKLRFLKEVRHHFQGWHDKVSNDFSKDNFETEINKLKNDEVYEQMGFANKQYVAIRLMGRMSISIGRRLGEIYDKIPRFAAKARFDLDDIDIAPTYNNLELDVQIPFKKVNIKDQKHISNTLKKYNIKSSNNGIGIEIRYNFNPNDSSRLRKDVDMAETLVQQELTPVYLIFSTISPREDAIKRLKKKGWRFLIGEEAYSFMNDLIDMDIRTILSEPSIKEEINNEVNSIMKGIFTSYAFKQMLDD